MNKQDIYRRHCELTDRIGKELTKIVLKEYGTLIKGAEVIKEATGISID